MFLTEVNAMFSCKIGFSSTRLNNFDYDCFKSSVDELILMVFWCADDISDKTLNSAQVF